MKRLNRMTFVRAVLLAVLLPVLTWAGQSLVLTPGTSYSFADPALNSEQSWRLEFQIHNWQLPPSPHTYASTIAWLGGTGVAVEMWYDGRLALIDLRDSISPAEPCFLSLVGRSNVLVRFQRNVAANRVVCELWNSNGTDYIQDSAVIVSRRSHNESGGGVGYTQTNTKLAFLRISKTLVPEGDRPPATAAAGEWTELKFDSNGNDASGNSHHASLSGASFVSTPPSPPVVMIKPANTPSWADWIPLRAGYPNQLDGSRSYSMADASYAVSLFWQQVSGPTNVSWSSRTSATPTITGLIFGSYVFRLEATDSAGMKSTADFEVGAVAWDKNGIVIYPDERLYAILGPATPLGRNPWEWFDARNLDAFKFVTARYEINGGPLSFEPFRPLINGVAPTGTAYVAFNSNKIYGTGTNFCEVLCGSSTCPNLVTAPGGGEQFLYVSPLRPHSAGVDAAPQPYTRWIKSCESNTEITMIDSWLWEREAIPSPGVPWTAYGFCATCGNWRSGYGGGPDNDNYYDNGLASYALYYRSGSSKARDAARWIADNYYRLPTLYSFSESAPRYFSLGSAFIRATADHSPDMLYPNRWPAIREYVEYCAATHLKNKPIDDERENAFCLWYTSLAANLDPDNSWQEKFQTRLENLWSWQYSRYQKPEGYWVSFNYWPNTISTVFQVENGAETATRVAGDAIPPDWCGTTHTQQGTIRVLEDRVTVIGTGTTFAGAVSKVIVLRGTLNGEAWSMIAGIASVTNDTKLTLKHPWRGDQGSVSAWRIYNGSKLHSTGEGWHMFFGKSEADGSQPYNIVDEDNWYWCTWVDDNTITLDKPYTGDTSGGNVYRRPMIYHPGLGSQPFMDGLIAQALYAASDALRARNPVLADNYKQAADRTVDYLFNLARNPDTKGFYYLYGFSHCRNTSFRPMAGCQGDDNERDYVVETIGAFAQKYLRSGSAMDLARGDTVYTDLFAATGFRSPTTGDGRTVDLIAPGNFQYHPSKFFGQTFGVGNGHQWPAAASGVQLARWRDTVVTLDFASFPNASKARLTVTQPNGVSTTTECTASPCHIQQDLRQGRHWLAIEYLNEAKAAVGKSEPQLLQMPRDDLADK